jgi:hypothetical protein
MMQGLSGLFSTTSNFRKGSMQTGYVGRMVQQLENKVGSLIETSRIIGLAKTRLELSRIAVDHEIATQRQLLQHEINSMQNQLRILVEPSAREGETSISESMGALEGYIRNSIQSFQHLTQILEERSTDRSVHEFAIRPFEETKLVRRLGKLQGMVQANQFVSLPRESVDIMVIKLARKIVLRYLELQHEVLSLGAESGNLVERIQGIQLEVSRKNFEISNEYIDRSVGFVRGEELSTADSTSANVKILKICVTAQQELLMRLVQQMTAVAQENSVDADSIVTVCRSGAERILELLHEIGGFIFPEERPNSQTYHLQSRLLELAKALLLEEDRLRQIVFRSSEDHELRLIRICDASSGIGQEISNAYQQHLLRLVSVIQMSNSENRRLKMEFLVIEYNRLRETAGDSTSRAMVEVVKAILLSGSLEFRRLKPILVEQIASFAERMDHSFALQIQEILREYEERSVPESSSLTVSSSSISGLPMTAPAVETPTTSEQGGGVGGSTSSSSSSTGPASDLNHSISDPAFFLECSRQSSQIVTQITQMVKELSRLDDDEINQLSRGIIEGIRPLIPSGTPAIADQPESGGGSIPSQSSSSSGI